MDTKGDKWRRRRACVERHSPLGLATLAVFIVWMFGEVLVAGLAQKSWSINNLYAAAFDWSAIQTAFMFSVYAFVVGHSGDFLSNIRNTRAFKKFMQYTRHSLMSGFLLTLASMPLLVVEPLPVRAYDMTFVMLSVWIGLFVLALVSFARVALIMWLIARVSDRKNVVG